MTTITRCLLIALAAGLLGACSPDTSHAENTSRTPVPPAPSAAPAMSPEQTAAATATAMLALAEAGDWGGYVDQYYGESHKFRSPADRDALVTRFEERWGDKVLGALRAASGITPTIEADGRAFFTKDGQLVVVLHPGDDGRWTFHL